MNQEIMKLEQVATYLRCHPSTIYRLLKNREIPAFKLGGSNWRFSREAVDRWIKSRRVEARFDNPNSL